MSTRYVTLWTKFDLQVLKKVAANSGGLAIWVLSIKIQKSNIGKPWQPLTGRLPNISKILDFLWSNPQKGTSIGHYGTMWDHQDQGFFGGKKGFGSGLGHWDFWGCQGQWGWLGIWGQKNHYWVLQSQPYPWIYHFHDKYILILMF